MLLVYKKADGTEARVRLKTISRAAPITIGRDQSADIAIEDPQASRVNCAIRYWDDIFVIRDMASSNGTYLNGQKIEVTKLNPGDVIKIGGTEIRVQSDATRSDVTAVIKEH
jgi:pSer/pThr/pTyr-binding forkhead associated (FHA) protein